MVHTLLIACLALFAAQSVYGCEDLDANECYYWATIAQKCCGHGFDDYMVETCAYSCNLCGEDCNGNPTGAGGGDGGDGGGDSGAGDYDYEYTGACGETKVSPISTSSYIVGGKEAIPHSIPWQVSIQTPGGFHFCGASIVNEHWIMTAAHCVDDGDANIRVVVGAHSKKHWKNEPNAKRYSVTKVHAHKEYSSRSMHNDIALLEIGDKMAFNQDAMPVCMPKKNYEWPKGSNLLVSGWGTLRSSGKSPTKLNQVTIPLYDHAKCAKENGASKIWEHVICAGLNEGGKDSCQGDSGGPLVGQVDGKFTLAGVVSWGYGCAKAGYPGVYTHVSHYTDWMNKIMKV